MSARTGEGIDAWRDWLRSRRARATGRLRDGRRSPRMRRGAPGGAARGAHRGQAARSSTSEAERLARLCHLMAERFARGGRLIAFGALAGGALGRAPRGGRVRPPGDRRQARAAGASALAGEGGDLARQVDAARAARRHRDRVRRRRGRRRGRARRVALARARGCLTIAFSPRGAEWEFEPPSARPVRPPGAGRDALPRAVGARARVLRPPRAARRAATPGACTTPARRASSTRSWPSSEHELEPVVDDVRRSVLMKAEEIGALRDADADREPRRR